MECRSRSVQLKFVRTISESPPLSDIPSDIRLVKIANSSKRMRKLEKTIRP